MGNPDELSRRRVIHDGRATLVPARRRSCGSDASRAACGRRRGGAPSSTAPARSSMLMISMVSSLSLWIALPLGLPATGRPRCVTSGSMQPLVTPGDVVMIRPVTPGGTRPEHGGPLRPAPTRAGSLHRIVEQMPDGTFRTQAATPTPCPDSEFVHRRRTSRGRPSSPCHGSAGRRCGSPQGTCSLLAAGALGCWSCSAWHRAAFDPAFDPWASGGRVNPAEVLLGRRVRRPGRPARRRCPEACSRGTSTASSSSG